jgi:signal transduction histidine kinase
MVYGLHRSVLGVVLFALAVGAIGGFVAQALRAGDQGAWWCVLLGVFAAGWPLAWIGTVRLVRPLRDLARVATEIRRGRLERRMALPEADDAVSDEVDEVAGALRGVADRVARQLADQRALMAAVSHELRSPLARTRVLVEMLREGTAAPTAHDDVQREIDAMDALVGDLLAAARIDFEALAIDDLDAGDLARRALELAHLDDSALGGAIDTGLRVRADATLAARAVFALLDNARRYGARTITLRIEDRGARVRFEVRDDGPGFPPGAEEEAFAPFWRGATADGSLAPRGEGLGLALVRRVATAHGGDAGAANRPEGGARVWIDLPRADATAGS